MIEVPHHTLIVMIIVICGLLAATVSRMILEASNHQKDYTELRQRIQSWWWMVGLLFLVLVLNKTTTIIFFAFVSYLALKEFLSIVPGRQSDRRVIFWAYVSIPMQYYWVASGWFGMFIIFIPVYVFLFIPIRMVLIGETKGFIKAAGISHWAVMLTVFLLSHIAYLVVLPNKNSQAGPAGLVLFLLLLTEFNDVSQYVWGKMFGKHKIIPKVSPNKTWEGFIGGVATVTLIAGVMAPYLTVLNRLESFGAGLIIGLSGYFGDVVISSVKRDLQIKDSGNLIPGHGGILDRIDSLLFTAPLFFHYIYYLHY